MSPGSDRIRLRVNSWKGGWRLIGHARYYSLILAEKFARSCIHEPAERWADSHCYTLFPEVNRRAQRLVRHRTTQGLSQKEAALEIGVDHGTLAKWVRGEREPALGT